jgi:RNA polymerase sigma-70 factor (ECF subfamily)
MKHSVKDPRPFDDQREIEKCLVRQCQAGDAKAWDDLFARHAHYVFCLCLRFTRRECEARDLAQEVFLRVFCAIHRFRPEEQSFVPWLTLTCRNLLIDNYRRNRGPRMTVSTADGRPLMAVVASATERPDGIYDRKETLGLLRSALLKVPPYLRETILLCEIHEMDYRDIAGVHGVPIGTVKSRLNRGRTVLARLLREHKPVMRQDYSSR